MVGCSSQSDDLDLIEDNCINKMKGSASFCNCMVEKAETELSASEIEFLASGFKKDTARAAELKEDMEQEEINKLGDFMIKAVTACAFSS